MRRGPSRPPSLAPTPLPGRERAGRCRGTPERPPNRTDLERAPSCYPRTETVAADAATASLLIGPAYSDRVRPAKRWLLPDGRMRSDRLECVEDPLGGCG